MLAISLNKQIEEYINGVSCQPIFLTGSATHILRELPDESVDFCMTSPPYWNKREYANGGIGLEKTPEEYIENLLEVFKELRRVLKKSGSLWVNLGDTYLDKSLVALPWRVCIAMIDKQGWILRNDIIWNKIKGPDNTNDRLRNTHEFIFHFVKNSKYNYYDIDAIRSKPREAYIKNGAVVSATGVTGVRYRRQIELSTSLTENEKIAALQALEATLKKVAAGEISDFRMVLRNQQRTTHSDSVKISGRAKELVQKGFYILKYHPNGSKPGDVWDIIPEDSQNRAIHYASYPEDLCKIPILATCPPQGIVLDPFCGVGTTNLVAMSLKRKSIGIDISPEYISAAKLRCRE